VAGTGKGVCTVLIERGAETHTDLAWYVIHTYSRHETKVEGNLHNLGLETFVPRITVRSRRRDRFRLLEVPLFPGYIFVHADLGTPVYYDILKNTGVVSILGNKRLCTPVPAETVFSLKKMVASDLTLDSWSRLVKGRRVTIVDGPLAGVTGVILRKKNGQRRLVVAVDLLGRAVAADLAEEAVESYH
jgi:transcription termination/antitermination protein NusG